MNQQWQTTGKNGGKLAGFGSRVFSIGAFAVLCLAGSLGLAESFAFADSGSDRSGDSAKPIAYAPLRTKNASEYYSLASGATSQVSAGLGTNIATNEEEKRFYALSDQYLQNFFKFDPSGATVAGIHDFDNALEDFSESARKKKVEFNKLSQKVFDEIDAAKLSLQARNDLDMLKHVIASVLFDEEVLQNWKKNPDQYSSFCAATLFPLIKRDFAPLDERLKSVIAREKQIPKLLADARKNIEPTAVPKIFAEIADEQLPGIIDFFKSDVPSAIKDAKDAKLKEAFDKSNRDVVAALTDYQKFVKDLIADKSACKGEYALGAERYSKLLELHEMVDDSLETLLARGEKELARLQSEFRATAAAIDAKAKPTELFESIAKKHPTPDTLLRSVKDVLARIRTYLVEKKIVTIPGADHLIVEDTPPYMKATTIAAMEAPGPFEQKATEAFYFVTLPEKSWDAKRVEEHLRAYSYPDILNTSVHEAYPGHYVQGLWSKLLATNPRRTFSCGSNVEGWAHYCEQMMLDQGFGNGDKELRLVQIHDALLRCCRYIVAIKMHTQGMNVQQATDFFMKEGQQEKANAEVEAKRGTEDPTYLVYTLGKLEILALRDQVKKAQGDSFDLQKFHDTFLSLGAPPLKIVRAELLAKYGLQNESKP
ncbi:MAG TPA: DUF885 domain-containing protein [Oculatellaceae cyanobacterium]